MTSPGVAGTFGPRCWLIRTLPRMAERTLTQEHLNRALLARQMLLVRQPISVPKALERLGGLQTQYAPSGYIGLWSRLQGFARNDLTRALDRRSAVQATLLRATIHMVSAADFYPFAEGVRASRRAWWLSAARQVDESTVITAAAQVEDLLKAGPLPREQIAKRLGIDAPLFGGVGLWLDMVRVPPTGTWERRRADTYGLARDWLGPQPASVSPEAGLALLARRYLGAFGPARRENIASWAGVPARSLLPILEGLPLRRFLDEQGNELLDIRSGALPDPGVRAPVRFLPTWDATLLVHARRTQILSEEHRPLIFNTKTPHSVPTFLVDGHVAGTWKQEGTKVVALPFERLPKDAREELRDETKALESFLA